MFFLVGAEILKDFHENRREEKKSKAVKKSVIGLFFVSVLILGVIILAIFMAKKLD
jgi:hypothetical protein